jgi:steroid delta-isomerase-like uncharacterized protein
MAVSEDNKALMRRFYDEVVAQGKFDLIDDMLADDFVEHEEFPGITPDRAGVKQFFTMLRAAYPDLRMTVEDLIAEGDKVVARIRIIGTHQGEFMGVPATGKQINVPGIDIVEFRDGRATAHWGVTDGLTWMQQLGAIPEPAGAAR